MKINPKILAALMKDGGAYGEELRQIAENYRDEIQTIMDAGIPVEFGERGGKKFAKVEAMGGEPKLGELPEIPALDPGILEVVAPPSAAPPADSPPAEEPQREAPKEPEKPEPAYDVRLTASDYKVKSRDGATPTITITPAGAESAQAALLFSMRRQRGEIVDVFLRVRRAPGIPAAAQEPKPKEAATVPIYEYECPKCHTTYEELQAIDSPPPPCPQCGAVGERIISAPGKEIVQENERNPEKKSRAQLAREIDEQVRDNELPPALADAQAKLASL